MPTRRTALTKGLVAALGVSGAALVGTQAGTVEASDSALLADLKALVAKYDTATPTPTPAPTPAPIPSPTPAPTPAPVAFRGLTAVRQQNTVLNEDDLRSVRDAQGCRIVAWKFSLRPWRDQDLPASVLQTIRDGIAAARLVNMPMTIRFAYWYNDGPKPATVDPSVSRVFRHIDQIAPVVNENADVVKAMEAGFCGYWGEWHYFGAAGSKTFGERSLANSYTGPRANLTRKLIDSFVMPVAFRYPRDIRWMFGFLSPAQKARVAMHNDAVLTEPGEWGTWESQSDRDWLQANFLSTPRIVGGEFGESTDYSDSELRDAMFALGDRQYGYHSWDSGNQPGGIKERLTALGLWDDLVAGVTDGW